MSAYSNVVTEIVDPVFDRANSRAEFRLPEGNVYLSSMRLLNVGIASSDTTRYNPAAGAYGALKSVSIYDGSELLDQFRLAPLLSAIKGFGRSNDENLSMNRHLKYNGLGYTAEGVYDLSGNAFEAGPPKVECQNFEILEDAVDATPEEAWISLKDILSFLGSSMVVPTTLFRQLRIVVEYNTPAENKYNLVKTNAAGVSSTSDALMVVDRVADGAMADKLMSSYRGVVYHPLETDQVRVVDVPGATKTGANPGNAAAAQHEQSSSFLLNGFNNKTLKRCMIVKQPTETTSLESGNTLIGYGKLQSASMWRSSFQLRVNGANILPGTALEGSDTACVSNRRLALLTDTWGAQNIVQGFQYTGFEKQSDYISADVSGGNILQRVGQQDFVGCEVGQRIQELVLEVGRYGVDNDRHSSQPLDVVVVGEVVKAVALDGRGGYVVQYL